MHVFTPVHCLSLSVVKDLTGVAICLLESRGKHFDNVFGDGLSNKKKNVVPCGLMWCLLSRLFTKGPLLRDRCLSKYLIKGMVNISGLLLGSGC